MVKFSNPFLKALSKATPQSAKKLLGVVNLKNLGGMVQGATLAYGVSSEVARWYNREITTSRMSTNVAATVGNAAGGFGGCKLGSALATKIALSMGGVAAAPVAAAVGCIFGGMVGSKFGDDMITAVMTSVFSISRSEAVENALRQFGVDECGDIHEVNKAYRRLSLQFHPDKNPEQTEENKKMWLSINVNLEVLRAHADFGTELAKCRKKRKQKQKTEL
jgi:hypothetical protein